MMNIPIVFVIVIRIRTVIRILLLYKVEMCGCAGNEMQELQEVPELSQTLNR